MNAILLRLRRSVRTTADRGASAVEYGLMIAAIAAVIVGTVFALGGFVKGTFDKTCDALNKPTGGSCVTTTPPAGGAGG
jgi:pilus assembly protein Flp/PilA